MAGNMDNWATFGATTPVSDYNRQLTAAEKAALRKDAIHETWSPLDLIGLPGVARAGLTIASAHSSLQKLRDLWGTASTIGEGNPNRDAESQRGGFFGEIRRTVPEQHTLAEVVKAQIGPEYDNVRRWVANKWLPFDELPAMYGRFQQTADFNKRDYSTVDPDYMRAVREANGRGLKKLPGLIQDRLTTALGFGTGTSGAKASGGLMNFGGSGGGMVNGWANKDHPGGSWNGTNYGYGALGGAFGGGL